jgi:hypothetical protein
MLEIHNVSKVSRIQSISLKQNKFQNNSGGKIHRCLNYTLVVTCAKIQVANKWEECTGVKLNFFSQFAQKL